MWIEISTLVRKGIVVVVTPRAGVWIEIIMSPLWLPPSPVTPRAGVWIEMGVIAMV